ncbi:MAG: Biofilm associated protein, partial [Fuerstiella sp.]|nr:Biofilm associated protein [Fuerstiella sp.]
VIELDLSGVSDAVGNSGSGTVDSNAYVIDTLVPVVTVEALTTNDTTPGLSGEVDDANATVSLTVAGQTVAAVNNGNGTWTLADDVLSPLTEGVYDVAVSATDAAGNVGVDTTTNELVIGVQPPVVTVDSLVTNDSTPTLTGTVDDPAATISVTVDGQQKTAVNSGDGTWVLDGNAFSESSISDGIYNVSVSATDVLGNVGIDDTADELVIDTVVPVVSVTNLLTNDSTPDLSGLVNDPTAVVLIVVDGQTVSAVNDEVGGWSVAGDVLAALGEGTYDVQATASDAAGNVGNDETISELEIDLTAPSVSVDALLTNDTTPLLTGAVNDNDAVVTVSVGGQSGQAVNNQNGTWAFEVPVGLAEGVYDVSVTAVDPATNSASDP